MTAGPSDRREDNLKNVPKKLCIPSETVDYWWWYGNSSVVTKYLPNHKLNWA